MKVLYTSLHKCGTSSFGVFAKSLGFKTIGPYRVNDVEFVEKLKRHELEQLFEVADKFEAFQDHPWPLFYKEFDERYADLKFIHWYRDPDEWYSSALKFFDESSTPMRGFVYGIDNESPKGRKDFYIDRYVRHNEDVIKYFKGRSDFLLIDPVNDKNLGSRICSFLGVPDTNRIYPHTNLNLTRSKRFWQK